MTEPSLPEKVVAIDAALAAAPIAHAFGGALALAYYAEPRATVDVDLNVFVPPAAWRAVHDALHPLGVERRDASPEPDGQCRWWWGRTPLDLFFAYADVHAAMERAIRRVPFAETTIPVLAPEHLVVCKVVFDRPKDWLDIEQIVATVAELDRQEIERHLDTVLDHDDPRRARFARLVGR